jgi:DNA-binding HxlR family transcriptional regulator
MTNEQIDEAIVARLRIGPCRFVSIKAALPDADMRQIDRRLQALQKLGKVRFGKAGWTTV